MKKTDSCENSRLKKKHRKAGGREGREGGEEEGLGDGRRGGGTITKTSKTNFFAKKVLVKKQTVSVVKVVLR